MKRREFIAVLGGAAALPLAAHAQRAKKLPTIGFMGPLTQSAQSDWTAAFLFNMRRHGWIDGDTITIVYRWAEGRTERFAEIAAELVRLKVDVIVTAGTLATIAAKQATADIPIVFGAVTDAVGSGIVASLSRPGGNVTGLTMQQDDTASKRIEFLRDIIPNLRRVAILGNVGNPGAKLEIEEAQAASRRLGLAEVATLGIRQAEDIAPALEALKGSVDALDVVTDPLVSSNRIQINTLALNARLPTMHGGREYVEDGGLLSYGPDISDMFRYAADFVDKVLHGAKPADMPVQQPTKFELVINLKTAKALALTIPPSMLLRADEVIE
jgi:putative tryptophan/tyrosine transport system substrate-binding protein